MTSTLRQRVGSKARSIVSGVVNPRFDTVELNLADVARRLAAFEQSLARSEIEIAALRQQVDECLDFIRIQHIIIRDSFAEANPVLGQVKGEQ
jgi:hypothetical protein